MSGAGVSEVLRGSEGRVAWKGSVALSVGEVALGQGRSQLGEWFGTAGGGWGYGRGWRRWSGGQGGGSLAKDGEGDARGRGITRHALQQVFLCVRRRAVLKKKKKKSSSVHCWAELPAEVTTGSLISFVN